MAWPIRVEKQAPLISAGCIGNGAWLGVPIGCILVSWIAPDIHGWWVLLLGVLAYPVMVASVFALLWLFLLFARCPHGLFAGRTRLRCTICQREMATKLSEEAEQPRLKDAARSF